MIGESVSHYRVLERLGSGGMGVVFKAEDLELGRAVAIKVLPPEYAADAIAVERIRREARAASALNHPNICTIYELNCADGRPFIAMELLDGETLKQRIERKPLGISEVLDIGVQIADALDAAHRSGVIHRDLKPANIFITTDARVKILDFGLAKRDGAERARVPGQDGATQTCAEACLTSPGTAVGTVAYMSPEQARGQELDARTDLFSFGVVLYEMVTRKSPFAGPSIGATFEAILTRPPAAAELPPELARVIDKCLEKDRDVRAQTAAELRADLRRLQRPASSAAVPARSGHVAAPKRKRVYWAASAVALCVVGAGGWFVARQLGLAGRSARSSWANSSFTQLTHEPGAELFPTLSPDGKSLVYQSRASGNWDIYLLRVGGANPINLTKDSLADDTQPAFSPDGERIAFRSERDHGGVFVMGATGESARRVADAGFNPAWSPDGREIVCATATFDGTERRIGGFASQLFVIPSAPASGTLDRRVISAAAPDAVQPQWSPHGWRIAYWSSSKTGNLDIWTMPAAGGPPVQVTSEPAIDWHAVWSPDGDYLYFLSERNGSMGLWRVAIDEKSGRTLGQAEQVITASASTFHFTIARASQRIAYVNRVKTGNIYAVDFDPVNEVVVGAPTPVTKRSWFAGVPEVSPDLKWVAFSTWAERRNLYVARVNGSELRQLTDDDARDIFPRWSPDGKTLAFMSTRKGTRQIWTIAADGSGLKQLTREPERAMNFAWSPDGSRMAFGAGKSARIMDVSRPWDQQDIETLPAPPGPSGTAFSPDCWSPDGKRLAGNMLSPAGENGIGVYEFESRQYRKFTDSGLFPHWLRDSRRLVFGVPGEPTVHLLDTASGRVKQILSVAPNGVTAFSPSPDDRRLYFGLLNVEADIWLMSR